MIHFRRYAAGLLAPLLMSGWLAATANSASASCAGPPVKSPHRFTGVVIDTSDRGRTATVRPDKGGKVTVTGAEEAGSITSSDRMYKTGVRYEFHPLNGASPYRDNACTATRELGPAAVGGADRGGKEAWWALPGGLGGWLVLAAIGLGALMLGAALVRRSVRTRPTRIAS